ncbi:hypothetical protein M409DRAFT_16175 [Zasmidium cellare ATCC 36951]|uniref:Uncharacterized protein n=1 Tax=Zasmidium cellare ATCC 36951 TaxID=1080233 RepID=A0A6A6D8D5_ZASCE|nr:uncharacterized protein M409DRAFT_16175 [Zasmidium cellare ATCC 36951]KAF2173906.1 hypothetical protein M409DRAFT_16175 [Zasmidium cellare ATCC 36951]
MFPLNRIPNYGGPAAPGFYSATDWQDRHFRNNNYRTYGPGWQTNPQAVFGYRELDGDAESAHEDVSGWVFLKEGEEMGV